MRQKKATKKFLKSAAKQKHGKEQATHPKKSFGKPRSKPHKEEDAEFAEVEKTIPLKQPTSKSGKGAIKG